MGGPLQASDAFLPLGITRRAISVGKDLIAPDGPPAADLPPPPPETPDLTDELVQRAQRAAQRRLMMGQSLSSSFLTGPLGDTSKTGP